MAGSYVCVLVLFFFLKDPAPPEISPLPLHDALPILGRGGSRRGHGPRPRARCRRQVPRHSPPRPGHVRGRRVGRRDRDRKSTRLNSSHSQISYAVFCLKKKTRQPTVAQRNTTVSTTA